jgi:hypothetical protein
MDRTYEAIIAGAKADGSWNKKYPEEDDDIQDYKKPWVGLTDAEIKKICDCTHGYDADERIARAIEKLLKDKNS